MLQEKPFSVTINVSNPINFCADKERHLRTQIQNEYVGKCYGGCYIVQLIKVLRPGNCNIARTNLSGEGFVDVEFLAKVHIFSMWDILVGVKVVDNKQMVFGTYEASESGEKAIVSVLASKAVEAISVGQLIAVRAFKTVHSPMQQHASVVSALLTCDKTAPVYKLKGNLGTNARIALKPMLDEVEAELTARAELIAGGRRADLWFFEMLLYSYRSATPDEEKNMLETWADGPQWEGPGNLKALDEGVSSQNVLDIVHRVVSQEETVSVDGYWSRPLSLYRSSPLAAVAGAEIPMKWNDAVDGTPLAVFSEFLKNILDFLTATRELVQTYNTRELIDKHLNMWSVMRAAQTLIE